MDAINFPGEETAADQKKDGGGATGDAHGKHNTNRDTKQNGGAAAPDGPAPR